MMSFIKPSNIPDARTALGKASFNIPALKSFYIYAFFYSSVLPILRKDLTKLSYNLTDALIT